MSAVTTSAVTTSTVWIDDDPECSTIAVTVKSDGVEYAVVCSGPKGMRSNDFTNAMRIAVAGLIRAGGGDMSVVGCGTLDDAKFDTGSQRAN
jgi:hypothetical protein